MDTPEPHVSIHVTDRLFAAAAKGISLGAIKDSLDELRDLCQKKIDASENFKTACKAVADKSRIDATVIAQYVTALVRDKMEEMAGKAEQLELLFTELDSDDI